MVSTPSRLGWLLLFCAVPSVSHAFVQTEEARANPALAPDDPSQSARRILHLKRGQVLRTLCQRQDGVWRLGAADSEKVLPEGAVERFASEKELLAERQRRIKASAQAVELAAWCLEAGLLQEGAQHLDTALGMHKQRVQANELLEDFERFLPQAPKFAATQEPDSYFEAQWSWLRPQNSPSLHTLAARHWAQAAKEHAATLTAGETNPWMEALSVASQDGFAPKRSFALSALCAWRGEASAKDLVHFAILDANESVRERAGWLLGSLDQAEQVGPLIGWLQHQNGEVRMRSAQALGQAGYAASVPALIGALSGGSSSPARVPHAHIFVGKQTAYLQDFSPEVAQFSSIADPEINVLPSGAVLDAGVVGITIERERIEVRRALQSITGHRAGLSAQAWNRWLEAYPSVQTDWRAPWPLATEVREEPSPAALGETVE